MKTIIIKAKALRKKGTDLWYYFDKSVNRWLYPSSITLSIESLRVTKEYIPSDAELIDIIILPQGGGAEP